jgi:drug/metabolite transporter (DMT)-like permease
MSIISVPYDGVLISILLLSTAFGKAQAMTRRSWLLLTALSATWGASYLFIKVALRDVEPIAIVGIRVLLGALVLLALPVTRRTLRALRSRWHLVVAQAVVGVVVPFLLITIGEQHVSSSLTGILIATGPVLVAVLAPVFERGQQISVGAAVGLTLGFVGVVTLLGLDLSGDADALIAAVMIIAASLSYSVAIYLLRRWFADVDPVGAGGAILVTASLLLLPFAVAALPTAFPGRQAMTSLLLLGVVGTGVAFVLFYTLITQAGAGQAALVGYLVPPFAVVYGAVLLAEAVTAGKLVGLALIMAGAVLSTRRRPVVVDGVAELEPAVACAAS